MRERDVYLILNAISKIGPITTAKIRNGLGERFPLLFEFSDQELISSCGISPTVCQSIRTWQKQFNLQRELDKLERYGAQFIDQQDSRYPNALRHLPDPPLGLYWIGSELVTSPSVAIVGTRHMTSYGQSVASSLARDFARMGWVVISGMARGIDTAAHWGALDAGGKTIAVLGHGIEQVYPPENGELRGRIIEQGGLLSEFPFGRRPDKQTFPMRNRLVSGLSDAVIVVETDCRGGSMITAQFAAEQGKSVFAVPGRIDQKESRGCHALIRDGAILLTSVEDVLNELNILYPLSNSLSMDTTGDPRARDHHEDAGLSGDAAHLWPLFANGRTWMLDELAMETSWSVARLQTALLMLELNDKVRKAPDFRYAAITRRN
jgi:DNA processing protein